MTPQTVIERLRDELLYIDQHAAFHSLCRRKTVGASLLVWCSELQRFSRLLATHNNPSAAGCSGVLGGCGCIHAEARLVLRAMRMHANVRGIVVTSYSPCTNCANLLVESKICVGVVWGIHTDHDPRGAQILTLSGVPTIGSLDSIEALEVARRWINDSSR